MDSVPVPAIPTFVATRDDKRLTFTGPASLPDHTTSYLVINYGSTDGTWRPTKAETFVAASLPNGYSLAYQGAEDFALTGLSNEITYNFQIYAVSSDLGYSAPELITITPGVRWRVIDGSTTNSCGLSETGKIYCWGDGYINAQGIATDLGRPTRIVPPVDYSGDWHSLSVADDHACAITVTGKSYCWGAQYSGGLGNGLITSEAGSGVQVPALVIEPLGFSGAWSKIATGDYFNCMIDDDGKGYCVGRADYGMLGNTANGSNDTGIALAIDNPIGFSGKWIQISTGHVNACGIDDGNVGYCWGYGNAGALGVAGLSANQSVPIEIDTPAGFTAPWKALHAAAHYSCGLDSAGKAYCWGSEWGGSFGNGSPDIDSDTAVAVSGGLTFDHLGVNGESQHVCGITVDKKVYCWDYNNNGECGIDWNISSSAHVPNLIPIPGNPVQVRDGEYHSCAVNEDGEGYCWGYGSDKQLGNDAVTNRTFTPVRVKEPL